ncbi:MAG: 4Fe-4S binding protein [Candidatus Hodarchaeota archaeon]
MPSIIEIKLKKCVGCAYCAMVCPIDSFKVQGFSYFLKRCNKCKLCVFHCPVSAIIPLWED